MQQPSNYTIGTPGTAWGEEEKQQWLQTQSIQRSYQEQVVNKLHQIKGQFQVEQYGLLSYPQLGLEQDRYPLFAIRTQSPDANAPTVLITGGVHGYETSGVQGALLFVEKTLMQYQQKFNFVILPCISPWGYETINRWNPQAIDPNRSFMPHSAAQESALAMQYIASLNEEFLMHIDLHETTDTDNSEFRPAMFARDGKTEGQVWDIPDGFYLVGNSDDPADAFQTAIIQSVAKITHIAPSDAEGKIIGEPITQEGVINYAVKSLGLCAGMTDAKFTSTTEVYPDSPKVDDEQCNRAQVAAITGALDYCQDFKSHHVL
ncbi:hypothetical protein TDB9533_03816 [Thalassocella blandensis]|nr:hypothetical protein TDB9533_03816 [Thalassocella blandensis]